MGEEQENSTGVRSRGAAGEQHMGEEQCGFLFVCVFVVEYICVCVCVSRSCVVCVTFDVDLTILPRDHIYLHHRLSDGFLHPRAYRHKH